MNVKYDGLSKTRYSGVSNLVTILFSRKEITWFVLHSLRATASIHMVKKSVVVKMYLCCREDIGLIGLKKYNPHFLNGNWTTDGCKGKAVFFTFPAHF